MNRHKLFRRSIQSFIGTTVVLILLLALGAVAETSRVCAYDRAGYGWSEPQTSARTAQEISIELHLLLKEADIEPPYILAGHSFGGILIRTFTALYPDEVMGLVLIDSAHPNQFSSENCSPACLPSSAVQLVDSFYSVLPFMAEISLVRLFVPRDVLPLPFFAIPDDFPMRESLIATFSRSAHSQTVAAEWNAFPQSAEFVRRIETPVQIPVRLVTALNTYYEQPLPSESPELTTETWRVLQNDLLHVSADSEQVLLEEANHFSLLVYPEHAALVTATIIDLLEELRSAEQ